MQKSVASNRRKMIPLRDNPLGLVLLWLENKSCWRSNGRFFRSQRCSPDLGLRRIIHLFRSMQHDIPERMHKVKNWIAGWIFCQIDPVTASGREAKYFDELINSFCY